jgi:hypothetical protein
MAHSVQGVMAAMRDVTGAGLGSSSSARLSSVPGPASVAGLPGTQQQ